MSPRLLFFEDPDKAVSAALEHLEAGGILGLPTETVYGIAALLHPAAVERIFRLKGRPADNPLPLQTSSLELALRLGFSFPCGAVRLAEHYWPGPLTLVLPRPPFLPDWFAPGAEGIALRIPSHPLCRRILEALELPLAVTSANISGSPPAGTPAELAAVLSHADDLLILASDDRPSGTASTVVEARGEEPLLLRPGAIPFEEIQAVWEGKAIE